VRARTRDPVQVAAITGSSAAPSVKGRLPDPPALPLRREVCLVVLLVLAAALPTVIWPMGRDQAIQAYSGWAFFDGAVPGRDVWDHKPPGTGYLYGVSQALFGHTQAAIRWFDLLWSLATALGLAALARRWFGGGAGLAAGALWAWSYATVYDFWSSAQVDGFLVLPCLGALWLVEGGIRTRRPWQWCAAGALIAQAFVIKYIVLALGLALLAALIAARGKTGLFRGVLVPLLWTFLGFAVGLAPWVTGLAAAGGLGPVLDAQRIMNAGYTMLALGDGTIPLIGAAGGGVTWFSLSHLPLLVFALVGLPGLRRVSPPIAAIVVGWLLAAVIGWLGQMKFYHYHSLPLLAPLALLSGLGVHCAVGRMKGLGGSRRSWSAAAAVPLIVAALGAGSVSRWAHGWADLVRVSGPGLTREDLWRAMPRYLYRSSSVTANIDMARWLTGNSDPGDLFYIWGFEPLIYFLAERPAPTRYIYNVPQLVSWGAPEWRDQLVEDLRSDPPLHMVVCHHDEIPWTTGRQEDSALLLSHFQELRLLLEEEYVFLGRNDLFSVYRRKELRL
jgi:hypothetical protein